MLKLGVNIDHVATLRQARKGIEPEPACAALTCESAGADSIVAHLREDRRHINEQDLRILKQVVKTRLNLEMSVAQSIVDIATQLKPDQATLVPEKRQELTTEGGLDVVAQEKKIAPVVRQLEKSGVEVSLFIDPDKEQLKAAKGLGVRMVELHTGSYAEARDSKEAHKCFGKIHSAAAYARTLKLHVFAGHGLTYDNVGRIAAMRELEELNIGYSIICRAVMVGLERAVREMKQCIACARGER